MNLSVRPPRRRRRRILLLLFIVLLSMSLLAWHQSWLPKVVMASLERNVWQYTPPTSSQLQTQPDPQINLAQSVDIEPVVLVASKILENPQSAAHTAALHLDTDQAQTIPWPNVGGRTKVLTYTVQWSDTLWSIANQFELDLDTLRWSNPELERNPDVLSVGTELVILPVQGVYHYVVEGDTVESIAVQYGVSVADIVDYPPNAFYPPYDFEAGQGVIVPFGRKDVVLPKPAVSADFALAWPIVSAASGDFAPDHPAIDIGAPYGSTVYAANGGTVLYADWSQDGLGYTVVIDHGKGFRTWYAHLKGTFLKAGNLVTRGTPVGEVGSTGHSSGPHVHFEVRINDEQVNPLDYLPRTPQ